MAKFHKNYDNDDNDPDTTKSVMQSPEETWEKRYGDLRRHSQKQIDDLKKTVNDLQAQNKKPMANFPKTKDEVEEWARRFPDAYGYVKSLIGIDLQEITSSIEERFERIQETESKNKKESAEIELLRIHPDFNELKEDDDFIAWLDTKSQRSQNALYAEDDPVAAAEVITMYKLETGSGKKSKSTSKDAAREINVRNVPIVHTNRGGDFDFSESQIESMKSWEYEEQEDDIEKARRAGRILMDLSGAAR